MTGHDQPKRPVTMLRNTQVQRIAMEWCFRMLLEPRRLAWRYLSTNYLYAGLLLAEKIRAVRAKHRKPTV
jgi:N-acetylglucosaminyldiphosphoundecaprenol N-acetyl-beta-D-mannosaminyltransferase